MISNDNNLFLKSNNLHLTNVTELQQDYESLKFLYHLVFMAPVLSAWAPYVLILIVPLDSEA